MTRRPKLNRFLTLEEVSRLPDGAGGFTQSWVAIGALWAEVRSRVGSEKAQESATLSTVSYRITVRAAPEGAPSRPKPDQRFREGSRIFRITAVAETAAGADYLTCFAREEVAA